MKTSLRSIYRRHTVRVICCLLYSIGGGCCVDLDGCGWAGKGGAHGGPGQSSAERAKQAIKAIGATTCVDETPLIRTRMACVISAVVGLAGGTIPGWGVYLGWYLRLFFYTFCWAFFPSPGTNRLSANNSTIAKHRFQLEHRFSCLIGRTSRAPRRSRSRRVVGVSSACNEWCNEMESLGQFTTPSYLSSYYTTIWHPSPVRAF